MRYSARLLYECVLKDAPVSGDKEPLFEEKLVVFECGEIEDLMAKLTRIAKRDELEFENVFSETVQWLFREVLEVQEMIGQKIEDGTEVFYRLWQDPNPVDFEYLRRTETETWCLPHQA